MNVNFKSPIDVQIEVTDLCNHKCKHCYNSFCNDSTVQSKKQLSMDEAQSIICELLSQEVLSVTLTGGEPFLNPDVLLYLAEELYANGLYVSINSNLTVLPQDALVRLSKLPRVKILTTIFSHNHSTHDLICGEVGAFEKTINNIKQLINHGVHVSVNMVLCKENLNDVFETGRLAATLHCDAFCCTRVSAPLWNKEYRSAISTDQLRGSIDTLLKVKEAFNIGVDVLGCYPKCAILGSLGQNFFGRRCMAGKTTVTIGCNSGVRPCSHSSREYGNLKSEHLDHIWSKMDDWRKDLYVPEKCKSCKLYRLCSGGCRVDAEARGDIYAMDVNARPELVEQFSFPVSKKKRKFPFSMNDRYVINPEISFRSEQFGGILLIKNTMNFLNVNRPAYDFLVNYPRSASLDYSTFLGASGAETEDQKLLVGSLFQRLIEKMFILPDGGEANV